MSYITVIALVFFIGYAVVNRVSVKTETKVDGEVQSESSLSASLLPELSASTSATPRDTVKPTPKSSASSSANSKIDISVDSNLGKPSSEKLIYPGSTGSGNRWETSTSGETVYDWYKSEMEKRSYQIRNNVKTRANDQFKGVLQGVSGESSMKVTIDQENASAKTIITLE